MPSMQQNLQGRTVYKGGSYGPTRGQVSAQGAMGYLRRETRKPANQGLYGGVSRRGRDGQSDTRSGAAARMLGSRGKWMGQEGGPGYGGPNNGRPGTGIQAPSTQQQQKPEGTAPPAAGTPAAPPAASTPTMTVNAAGTLELPYSPAWNSEVLTGLEDTNATLADIQRQRQQQALLYADQQRQANEGYEVQKRDTLNDNSARGVAFSSGYGVGVGRDANNFNNILGALATDNTNANADFDFQATSATNAFKAMLARASDDYANALADDAGTLGYGEPEIGGPGSGGLGGGSQGRRNGGYRVPDYNGGWANYKPPKPKPKPPPRKPTGGGRGKK